MLPNRYHPILLALGCGLLLFAAWPVSPFTLLIFVAWVPLLWLETMVKSRKRFFAYTYLAMLIWNLAATWWIWNASPPGAIAAFLANSLIMCLPWLGYSISKKWLGERWSYFVLVAFWMTFEFIHLTDWGLSWPWLTLGNAFATHTEWIQWYEYTGTSGGTLWIWASNILIFILLKEYQQNGRSKKYITMLVGWLFLFLIPAYVFSGLSIKSVEQGTTNNIVVVQPNIDPYEKVSDVAGSLEAQQGKLISISEKVMDSNTVLVVWPETALYSPSGIDESTLKENFFLNPMWGFLMRHPRISLFTGIESFRPFQQETKYTEEFDGRFYEFYNGSMVIDTAGAHSFYHKSMLVPGVETLPWFLKFLKSWFRKFGGTGGGYAKQSERSVLDAKGGYKIAPAICYESIYGDFMRRYIKNGANIICIITNDGWWKKTPGHKQHLSYARLRAIENRTWVARSANTGISAFIDPNGNVIDPMPYNTQGAIKLNVPAPEPSKTFYVKYGDVISLLMSIASFIFIVWIFIIKISKSIKKS